jgi:hypothetical protein
MTVGFKSLVDKNHPSAHNYGQIESMGLGKMPELMDHLTTKTKEEI